MWAGPHVRLSTVTNGSSYLSVVTQTVGGRGQTVGSSRQTHTLKYFPFHGFNISQAFYRKLLILPLISLSSPSASASSFLHLCDHFKLLCELFLSQRRACSMKHLFKPTCPVNVNLQLATTQFPCRANRIYQLLQRSLADECLWWTNGPETAAQGIKVTACMSSSEEPQRDTKKQKREIFKHLQKHRNDR